MNVDRSQAKRMTLGKVIRVAGTIVALALLVWLLAQQDWGEIWQNIEQIGLSRFALAAALLLASRFAISLRWYALLRGAGEKPSYWASLKITFAGLFSNNFLPSTVGGDGVRLAGGMQAGWNGAVVAASLVMDRLVGMFGMATFLPFTFTKLVGYYQSVVLPSSTLVTMASVGANGEPDGTWLQKLFRRIWAVVLRVWQTIVLWVRRPRTLVLPLVYNYGHILFTFTMIWVILAGLGTSLSYLEISGLWAAVYFISLLPISIGGLGLQEWAIWFVFHQIAGVSQAHSLTLALLYRTLMMLTSLPGAALVSGIIGQRKKGNLGDPTLHN